MLSVLSGGGTAGHINPALALAEELADRSWDVVFAGTPHGVESRLVPQAGIPFKAFEASGFDRSRPLSIVKALRLLNKSTKAAKQWLSELSPDVVVGFGGYVSIPVAEAARHLHIPVVVHEQNSVMGLANKKLSKHACAVCVTYASSAEGKANVIVTGNPVRKRVLEATRDEGRMMLDIPDDALMLLVFGGSLGARHINKGVCALKGELLSRENLYVVHITGPKEFDATCEMLSLTESEAKRWRVMGYQDRMGETLAATDMIISRAGATSLAEISARAIPALLVPFPYATADHQTTNAQEYVNQGCAYMIPDSEVETAHFADLVFSLVDDATLRASMQRSARAQNTGSAAARLADVVISAVHSSALSE